MPPATLSWTQAGASTTTAVREDDRHHAAVQPGAVLPVDVDRVQGPAGGDVVEQGASAITTAKTTGTSTIVASTTSTAYCRPGRCPARATTCDGVPPARAQAPGRHPPALGDGGVQRA